MATVPSGTRFIGIATSVDLTERKSAVLNKTTEPFTIEDIASTVGVGTQGPQGVQGPAGPLGPVGPAGLEWQGAWVSGTSYVADDAVGYDGASWFCILATSGTTTPDLDATHWALLASQGAQGIQGVQGPTGEQGIQGPIGPQGAAPTKTVANITATALFPVLTADINYATTSGFNRGILLPTTTVLGKEVIIYTNALALDRTILVKVDLIDSPKISYQGISSNVSQIDLKSGENWKFTALNGGYWKAEAIGATLQQVVSVGNTINDGTTTLTILADSIKTNDFSGGKVEIVSTFGDNPYLKFGLPASAGKTVVLTTSDTQTANRTIKLPDASGTIALQTYKSYVAILSQTGTGAPTATVIKNEIGTITFSYSSTGEYSIDSSSLFTNGKTIIFAGPGRPLVGNVLIAGTSVASTSSILLYSRNASNVPTNALVSELPIEIRVYA